MTMRKRIFISNTIMVLISLVILFGIGGSALLLFKDEFMNVIEQNSRLSENTYEIQTLLKEAQSHPPVTWEELSEKAGAYDFELYVSDENLSTQFSNVRHSEWECIEELENENFSSETVQLYSMENVTIAKCMIQRDGQNFFVYASYYPGELSMWGMDRGMFEMFIIVFILSGMIAIAGLLFCCQLFTKLMIKKIMQPVDELNQAALRINDGNLNETIEYQAEDEFGEVCSTFNGMQSHLKEEMEKTRKYELARTEMISGISHDLRTPLTSVKGFIKGMLDGIASTPEKKQQYLEISYQKACDMEILLQKLFFFSKLETGNMPFFLQKVELKQWLDKLIQEKMSEKNEVNYEIQLEAEHQEYITDMDVEQMKRVFDNLLENSMKYAEKELIRICISLQKKEDHIIIRFADNGSGIAEDKLPHVFEQFYRGDESRNSKKDGSGLGLYVCKYIVEQQNGIIKAYNRDGFVVEITLSEEKEMRIRKGRPNGKNIDSRR